MELVHNKPTEKHDGSQDHLVVCVAGTCKREGHTHTHASLEYHSCFFRARYRLPFQTRARNANHHGATFL